MKQLNSFEIDGKKIIFRYPKLSDTKKIWKFYNRSIKESLQKGGLLSSVKSVTLKEERIWIKNQIKKIKKKDCVYILAEQQGKIIGTASVERVRNAQSHAGVFGIVILEKFTGKGLGTMLMNKIIQLAKKELKVEIIKLGVFGNNKRAQNLYTKLGFKETGRIKNGIKVKGRYQDEITMVKYF